MTLLSTPTAMRWRWPSWKLPTLPRLGSQDLASRRRAALKLAKRDRLSPHLMRDLGLIDEDAPNLRDVLPATHWCATALLLQR